MEVFVPFSERLVEQTGVLGRLVPFQLEYPCARLHGWESVEILTDNGGSQVQTAERSVAQLQAH